MKQHMWRRLHGPGRHHGEDQHLDRLDWHLYRQDIAASSPRRDAAKQGIITAEMPARSLTSRPILSEIGRASSSSNRALEDIHMNARADLPR